MMDTTTRHHIEEAAIMLEKKAEHFSSFGYPWYNRKIAGAFWRSAKLLRKQLEEGD